MMATGRLAGRKAIVTGAASGIGREIARLFSVEGARVAAFDIGSMERLDSQIVTRFECDVSNEQSVERCVTAAAQALGGIDAVVNAAGILVHRRFEATTSQEWQRLFEVNLHGPALVCAAALPHLRRAEGATIVNISSQAAVRPSAGTAAYAASKAGLLMLTKCLALELAPIRVNAICPGIIATPMTDELMSDEAMRNYVIEINALHTVGKPADVAGAALYLTSDESRFVNGTQILIDGGSAFT